MEKLGYDDSLILFDLSFSAVGGCGSYSSNLLVGFTYDYEREEEQRT